MKKLLSTIFAIIGWFAIITQFVLMMQTATTTVGETIIRFFSYFTILTNTIVAIYFTREALTKHAPTTQSLASPLQKNTGVLTAITIYILIVGLVYQFLLRHTWSPQGLNKLVDELLHSVIPILVLLYWYLYENRSVLQYRKIPKWLVFPAVYALYTLVHGSFTGWYPYPFLDVNALGTDRVVITIILLLLGASLLSALLIFVGKILPQRSKFF